MTELTPEAQAVLDAARRLAHKPDSTAWKMDVIERVAQFEASIRPAPITGYVAMNPDTGKPYELFTVWNAQRHDSDWQVEVRFVKRVTS